MMNLTEGLPLQAPEIPEMHAVRVERQIESPWGGGDFVLGLLAEATPWRGARAVLVGDLRSGQVFLAHREEQMLPIASLTKIMTVVVALERYGPEALVTVTEEAVATEGAKVPLLLGDRLSVAELVRACMIRSGNDAAIALAAHAPRGTAQFVGWMNDKAAALGLTGVHFANPMGFDAENHFATAKAMFDLARYAVETHPLVREAARAPEMSIRGERKNYLIKSTNALLGDGLLAVEGLKTGTTEGAGQSLMTLVRLPDGRELMAVVLGSPERFGETKTLLWWVLERLKANS